MIERLRTEVDETRNEVDHLAYKLLELSSGVPDVISTGNGWHGWRTIRAVVRLDGNDARPGWRHGCRHAVKTFVQRSAGACLYETLENKFI